MKLSIRTKFGFGMVFIFLIILVLIGSSAYYLNKLSNKTSAILNENYLSLAYAREMTDGLSKTDREVSSAFLEKRPSDKLLLRQELELVDHSLQLEKNNFTEPGEDKLVAAIESVFTAYRASILKSAELVSTPGQINYFQEKKGILAGQLVLLSQLNGKAIEAKTDDAKISAKKALTNMTILGSFCFLIALSFIYSFASYFSERFFQLYNGIREIVSSNYGQRLYFDGVDEFYEISVLFNQMAEKLNGERTQKEEESLDFSKNSAEEQDQNNVDELNDLLVRMRAIEKQAEEIISKVETKK